MDTTQQDSATSSPFLSLPTEVRRMVYDEIFSRRTIILRDRNLAEPPRYPTWDMYLVDPPLPLNESLSLLLICKHIHHEAQPLLLRHTPSHLVLSKRLHRLPRYYDHHLELRGRYGMPTHHVTRVSLSIGMMRRHSAGSTRLSGLDSPCLLNATFPSGLRGIDYLQHLVIKCLPALRELHIYHTLHHSLNTSDSGTCSCPFHTQVQKLSLSPKDSRSAITSTTGNSGAQQSTSATSHLRLAEIELDLRDALLSQYRVALPVAWSSESDGCPTHHNYITLDDLLSHGTHIYLHDEVAWLFHDDNGFIRNGRWHATYHLKPPNHAAEPICPSTQTIIKSGQLHREWKEFLLNHPELGPSPKHIKLQRLEGELQYCDYRMKPPEHCELPLTAYENGLRLNLLSEQALWTQLEDTSQTDGMDVDKNWNEEGYKRLWEWD